MKTCKFCGQEIGTDDNFCPFCGAKVNEDTTENQNQDQVNLTENQTIKNDDTNQLSPLTESEQLSANLPAQGSNIDATNSKPKFSGFAIAGFVVSLVGLFIFAIVGGVIGVIMSAFALKETKQNIKRGRGLAIAGLVISIIDIISFFLLI